MPVSGTLTAMLLAIDGLGVSQDMVVVLGIVAIVVLLALSGFFSSSEIAMFSLAKHRVDALVEEGTPSAERVRELKQDPHRLLVTILVGNNIANIAMSSIATVLVGFYFGPEVAFAVATLGITTIVLLFGEAAPKSYAVEYTESWALTIARPLQYAEYLLLPLVVTFDYLTRVVNTVTGGRSAIETSYVTRDEIQHMIKTGEREGVIEEDEREMLQRIFRFNRTIAKEVMTPRLDMEAVSVDESLAAAIEACIGSGHERVPVYEGGLDNVIGVAVLNDLVREQSYGENGDVDLRDVIQPTLHVPESKNVDELLAEMRENRLEMVIVIDEFGTTEGLITMEDMVEEIVGEILGGGEDEPIEFVGDDTAVVQGEVNIDEVNEALGINLPEGEEFETIAGFIFNRAGRLVDTGEQIVYDGVELQVGRVENTRITEVRVTKPDDEDEAAEPTDATADEAAVSE
jgi:putative hemolysin